MCTYDIHDKRRTNRRTDGQTDRQTDRPSVVVPRLVGQLACSFQFRMAIALKKLPSVPAPKTMRSLFFNFTSIKSAERLARQHGPVVRGPG